MSSLGNHLLSMILVRYPNNVYPQQVPSKYSSNIDIVSYDYFKINSFPSESGR